MSDFPDLASLEMKYLNFFDDFMLTLYQEDEEFVSDPRSPLGKSQTIHLSYTTESRGRVDVQKTFNGEMYLDDDTWNFIIEDGISNGTVIEHFEKVEGENVMAREAIEEFCAGNSAGAGAAVPTNKQEKDMNIKIERATLINGIDSREYDDSRIISMIKVEVGYVEALEELSVAAPSRNLEKKLSRHEANIKGLTEILDSRIEEED